MPWKPVLDIFHGGTKEAAQLKGRKVQTNQQLLNQRVRNPAATEPSVVNLPKGAVGFVGVPEGDWIRIAFPAEPSKQYASLDALMKGDIVVIETNWATFRQRFLIET
jgi:hypothetical protein